MLDAVVRPYLDRALDRPAAFLAARGVSADRVTLAGFVCALAAMGLIASGFFLYGFFFVLANRVCDGLDGAVARRTRLTDFGGYLDIVTDMFFYAGIVFAFALARPEFAVYAAFLIFSFMTTASSFLAWAILAAKRGQETQSRGKKSFYYIGGLCEGAETIAALALMCLVPAWFPVIALVFGVMCLVTSFVRLLEARRTFS